MCGEPPGVPHGICSENSGIAQLSEPSGMSAVRALLPSLMKVEFRTQFDRFGFVWWIPISFASAKSVRVVPSGRRVNAEPAEKSVPPELT